MRPLSSASPTVCHNCLFVFVSPSLASLKSMFSPYGSTNDTIVGWMPEPKSRGTSSILTTCILTLVLCVWTAVHLNIPQYKHAGAQLGRKIGWLVMGMLAPEMVSHLYRHPSNPECARPTSESLTICRLRIRHIISIQKPRRSMP